MEVLVGQENVHAGVGHMHKAAPASSTARHLSWRSPCSTISHTEASKAETGFWSAMGGAALPATPEAAARGTIDQLQAELTQSEWRSVQYEEQALLSSAAERKQRSMIRSLQDQLDGSAALVSKLEADLTRHAEAAKAEADKRAHAEQSAAFKERQLDVLEGTLHALEARQRTLTAAVGSAEPASAAPHAPGPVSDGSRLAATEMAARAVAAAAAAEERAQAAAEARAQAAEEARCAAEVAAAAAAAEAVRLRQALAAEVQAAAGLRKQMEAHASQLVERALRPA